MSVKYIDWAEAQAELKKHQAEKRARVNAALERFGLSGRRLGDWDDILIAIDERLKRLEDVAHEPVDIAEVCRQTAGEDTCSEKP